MVISLYHLNIMDVFHVTAHSAMLSQQRRCTSVSCKVTSRKSVGKALENSHPLQNAAMPVKSTVHQTCQLCSCNRKEFKGRPVT